MSIDEEDWHEVLGQYRPATSHRLAIQRLASANITPDDLAEALAVPLRTLDAESANTIQDTARQALLAGEVAEYFAACSDAATAARAGYVARLVELSCVNDAAKTLHLSQGYVSRLYRRPRDPFRPVMASLRRLLSPMPAPVAEPRKDSAQ